MIQPGLCVSYKADILRGVHREDDRYMLALYTKDASLDTYTSEYTSQGEVSGLGYASGGVALKGFEVVEDGEAAAMRFDDVRIEKCTLHNVVGALIYNASRFNRSVCVIKLSESTSSTNGAFEIIFPVATASEAVIVLD